ncbi:MAG: BON domain-containing protein [Gammaproteobacteria bacterium]
MLKRRLTSMIAVCLLALSSSIYAASTMEKVGQDFSDTGITASVMALYVKDTSLNIFKINVETNQGVVTLSGTVDNQQEYQKAVSLAQSVDGVKSVNYSQLKVKGQ